MISNSLSFLTRALIPAQCVHCSELLALNEQSVCQLCLSTLARIDSISGSKLQRLGHTIQSPFFAALCFEPPTTILAYQLKYGNDPALGKVLGQKILAPLIAANTNDQELLLCPMPIHPRRRWRRGYNQAEALARGAALGLTRAGRNARVCNLLKKTEHRKSQINFDNFARWQNTDRAFRPAVNDQRAPGGALVVLIDDTVTTGSSMIRAAVALKEFYPEVRLFLIALAQEI